MDLHVGDEVAIQSGASDTYTIRHVTKIGRTGIIEIGTGAKYRPNGYRIKNPGDRWTSSEFLSPVTDEVRQTMRKSNLVSQLSGLNYNHWKAMDLETLEAIVALIWPEQTEGKAE